MSARVSRMATLLELFVKHGELKAGDVAAHAGWPESVTESSGGEVDDPGSEPFFCLYSTGELLVQRDSGQQVCFSVEETRELFRWLDRLGGTDLARLAAAEEEVPA